jgi:hypothetical protein
MGFLLSAAFEIPEKLTTEITKAHNSDVIFFIITPSLLILMIELCYHLNL